jgi:hypothetical protein
VAGYCNNVAGFRTNNPNAARCFLHGGSTPSRLGRYFLADREDLMDALEAMASDPDPYDLMPEVTMLRAILQRFVNEHDRLTEALLAWHESFRENVGKPAKVPEILAVVPLVGQIGAMLDRIEKRKAQGSVPLAVLDAYVHELGMQVVQAAEEKIADVAARTAFFGTLESRWRSVRLDPKSGRSRAAEGEDGG